MKAAMSSFTLIIACSFITLGLVVFVTSDPCFDVFSAVQDDMYMEHHTYSKVITYSPYACAAQCLMSSVCLSFSYNTHRHICHLNDNNTAVTDIVSRHGFIYSDISPWPQSLIGPCSVTSCPGNSRCQVNRLHRASCMPEFQGCGDPPYVIGSNRVYDGHFVSATVIYTCNEDYMTCQNKTSSVCQSTGQWENVTGLCGQVSWHNPVLNIDRYIPCGPTNRFKVTIVGTPTNNVRTSIDVMAENDILFIVEFRFNFGIRVNKVLINTRLGGVYGEEIILDTMPLTVGQESIIDISLENGMYMLVVDGTQVYSLPERYPGVEPASVLVYGDVSIQSLQFTL